MTGGTLGSSAQWSTTFPRKTKKGFTKVTTHELGPKEKHGFPRQKGGEKAFQLEEKHFTEVWNCKHMAFWVTSKTKEELELAVLQRRGKIRLTKQTVDWEGSWMPLWGKGYTLQVRQWGADSRAVGKGWLKSSDWYRFDYSLCHLHKGSFQQGAKSPRIGFLICKTQTTYSSGGWIMECIIVNERMQLLNTCWFLSSLGVS